LLAYHPNVIKDANLAFADSARGKEYKNALGYLFLHPCKQADKGKAQPSATFILPSTLTSLSSSGALGTCASRDARSEGKSYKDNAQPVVTMATANILTYLTALVSMNTHSDLLPCLLSIPCICQVAKDNG
jgi:hypothetical protein